MNNPVLMILRVFRGIQSPVLNLNLTGLGCNLYGKYMSQTVVPEDRSVEVKEQFGDWIGGKTTGKLKIDKDKDSLIVQVNKTIEKMTLAQFKSLEEAEIHGKSVLYNMCKASGKLLNEYRYVQQGSETFLEVKIGKIVIKVDEQSKGLIENYIWEHSAVDKTIFRKEGKNKIRLEEDLSKIHNSKLKFIKIDGNIYNFSTKNIKPA